MEEVWGDIPGFEGYYQASNKGRIKSVDRVLKKEDGTTQHQKGIILKLKIRKDGYVQVCLSKLSKVKTFSVSRLVYETFNGYIPEGMDVNHIDCNPQNNNLDNLNLMSRKDNCNWGDHNKKLSESRKKQVNQFDVNGSLVKSYDSTISASKESGFNQGNISSCCNGKLKTANGYVWRFA
jgi:hypothetical protein